MIAKGLRIINAMFAALRCGRCNGMGFYYTFGKCERAMRRAVCTDCAGDGRTTVLRKAIDRETKEDG